MCGFNQLFNHVVVLPGDEVSNIAAAQYCLERLKAFQKCVFLSHDIMFLQNPDTIFEIFANDTKLAIPAIESGHDGAQGRLGIFSGRPSLMQDCSVTMEFISNWIAGNGADKLKDAAPLDAVKVKLESRIIQKLDYDGFESMTETDVLAVHFEVDPLNFVRDDYDPAILNNNFGLMEQAVIKIWQQLYSQTCNGTAQAQFKTEPIAIVGMSCRYPGAASLEEFWNVLISGKDATGPLPAFRHNIADPELRNRNGGYLTVPVDEFDEKFFQISPTEAEYLDPQNRLLLEVVWEGLEDAGVDPTRLRGTNGGVFLGSWKYDFYDILMESGKTDNFRRYMGNSGGAAAARISFLLGLTGPNIATESACSSSMVALHLAVQSLRSKQTSLALVCGANLILTPMHIPQAFSPDGRCKTFDISADGYGRAEGVGVLVLKRMSDAVRDNDRIWGLVRGTDVSQEGLTRSMGTPTTAAQVLAMQRALNDAMISPEEVSYVEAHGTGTRVGDPAEVAAIRLAYSTPKRKEPLLIGSVKTNVGHNESCSGLTGIMKVVLALQHRVIPPHRNLVQLNPAINLEAIPALIPLSPVEWKRQGRAARIAGVSSFGISGTDAHVLIQEAPDISSKSVLGPERPIHLLKISGKTKQAVEELLSKYQEYMETEATPNQLSDIAYSANVGRADFRYRATILAGSKLEAATTLKSQGQGVSIKKHSWNQQSPRKICFLFTGQGSQYPGMARKLYETSPVFRIHFDHTDKLLRTQYNIHIKPALWAADDSGSSLKRTIYSQPSIFCVEYALFKLWESWGVQPDYVLGHSLGEFAASVCAGILRVEEAIKLVAERSLLVDSLPGGKMVAVKANQGDVLSLLAQHKIVVDVAAVNSAEQTVLAGDSQKIMEFADICKGEGLKTVVLEATHAFHSKHMDPILEDYLTVVNSVEMKWGREGVGYISGVVGTLVEGSEIDAAYWVRHTRHEVNFLAATQTAEQLGCELFIEIGPQPVLSAMIAASTSTPVVCLPSLRRNGDEWGTLLNSLGKLYLEGGTIDWEGFDRFYQRNKVSLPHYPFSRKRFWPEINTTTIKGTQMHPLLGTLFPNASGTSIFHSGLGLESVKWVKDHLIGSNVIFPGAGFLEMCLAAGTAALTKFQDPRIAPPEHPVEVRNFRILRPLRLTEHTTVQLQLTLNPEGIKIFRKASSTTTTLPEDPSKWVLHAEGDFISKSLSGHTEDYGDFDLAKFKLMQFHLRQQNNATDEIYSSMSAVGLNFGPTLRSLKAVYREGNVLLAEVKLADESQESYILHPLAMDAMLQVALLMRSDHPPVGSVHDKLALPIKVGRLTWFPHQLQNGNILIYASRGDKESQELSIFLLDSEGSLIAVMEGVEMVETTVKAVQAAVRKQEESPISMPELWEEVWKPQVSPVATIPPPPAEPGSCWIVYKSDNPLCSNVTTSLGRVGRQVVDVSAGEKFEKTGPWSYIVNQIEKEHFERLAESIISSGLVVEGVLFFWSLDRSRTEQTELLQPYLYIVQTLGLLQNETSPVPPRLLAVTSGLIPIQDSELNYPHPSTIWGFTKSLKNENFELSCRCVDVGDEGQGDALFQEIWRDDQEVQVVLHINNSRCTPQLQSLKVYKRETMELSPGASRFYLPFPEGKLISDLKYKSLPSRPLRETDIGVKVRSLGLNFQNYLSIVMPTELAFNVYEISGVVDQVGEKVSKWKVGDPVFGVSVHTSEPFPSYSQVSQDLVVRLPPEWTHNDGVTIPVAFVTAYLSLVEVAQMQRGETVLIHAASGGVGLLALHLCRNAGVNVIVTAGSRRKRAFLKSLGLSHVFSSRTTDYADAILDVTSGAGVSIVLNSLTSHGFKEASLRACGRNGKFVEMSRHAIWKEEEVKSLRPDVKYKVIDITKFSKEEWGQRMSLMGEYVEEGTLCPLPTTRFDALCIKDALNHLQSAKHVGKVVAVMPHISHGNYGDMSRLTPLFSDNSTYLVTGGLGGIGLEVAKWMLSFGARHILLAGRQAPTPNVEKIIRQLNSGGAHLIPVQVDVGDYEQLKQLLTRITLEMELPPVRGVMHAAGALSDGLIPNQSWDKVSSTLTAKIDGTLNLDELTRSMRLPLEHFVLFSSIASTFGLPGQSNYAAGNNFEDTYAHYRHSIGLPATTVNWGIWNAGMGEAYEIPGINALSPVQGLAALEYLMKSHRVQTCVMNVDSFPLFTQRVQYAQQYLEKTLWKSSSSSSSAAATMSSSSTLAQANYLWNVLDSPEATQQDKAAALKEQVKRILRNILKMAESEELGDDTPFEELGVDSLMLIEIKNALQTVLTSRATVSATTLRDHETIALISSKVLELIEGLGAAAEEGASMSFVKEFIRRESILPEHINVGGIPPAGNIAEMEVVLLTGIILTGDTLGPHILRELSNISHISKIYCVVRPQKGKDVADMLRASILERLQCSPLEIEEILAQVVVVEGDTALPKFGMNQELWNGLASEVDAIFHCAAVVDHVLQLAKSSKFSKAIQDVNIGGVRTALEFASTAKLKRVFYASSLITLVKPDGDGASENWPEVEDFDDFTNMAYPITRFVADLLMKEAVHRGIPCKVFRFPTMGGHSESGRVAIQQNHQYFLYLQIMKLGMVPSTPFPIVVLPVDKSAQVSTSIFFHPEAPSGIYNVLHNDPITLPDFSLVAKKLGFPVTAVPHDEFARGVVAESNSPFQIFKEAYASKSNNIAVMYVRSEAVQRWLDGSKRNDFWMSKKIAKLLPKFYDELDSVVSNLEKDLRFCKEQGWFETFKLV